MPAADTLEGQTLDEEGPDVPAVEPGNAAKSKAVVDWPGCLTLEEVQTCDVLEQAKDKMNSRRVQKTLLKGEPEAVAQLRPRIEPFLQELSTDMYGNYVAQAILQVSDESTFARHFQKLSGQLLELSEDMHGTRITQKVVEQAIQRGMVSELVQALTPREAGSLSCNMTGFHVVGKLIELLPDGAVQPYLTTLCRDPKTLAMDQWGCNLLKKCLDRCEGQLFQSVVDVVIDNALELVQDPFGNYIVQHLVTCTDSDRPNLHISRIIDALQGKVLDMCMQKVSSNVLEKCLQSSSETDRNKIINEILNGSERCPPSEAVRRIVFHQFGNYVFQQAMQVAQEPQFSLLVAHSKQHIQDLLCAGLPKADSTAQAGDSLPALETLGSLPQENARRLACKLAKRYPELRVGLKWNQLGEGAEALANSLGLWYNPWTGNYTEGDSSMWASAYAPFWDASAPVDPAWQLPAMKSEASKKSRRGGDSKNRRGDDATSAQRQVQKETEPQKVVLSRVVGYWPDYTIEYDEVHVPEVQTPSQGSGKKNAKQVRSPKPKKVALPS